MKTPLVMGRCSYTAMDKGVPFYPVVSSITTNRPRTPLRVALRPTFPKRIPQRFGVPIVMVELSYIADTTHMDPLTT